MTDLLSGEAATTPTVGEEPVAVEVAVAVAGPTRIIALLRRAGLRPTRQRVALAALLFAGADRHVSAETVYEEAVAVKISVSLATVYNTLNQFTAAGLLRELAVSGAKSFFDTRTSAHHHFFDPHDGTMVDVEDAAVAVTRLPPPPPGTEIAGVEVMIRLRRIGEG